MTRSFRKSKSLFPILSLLNFENFFELLRYHKISHSPINDILSVITMRGQRIFLLSLSNITILIYVEYFLLATHNVLVPSTVHLIQLLYWLGIW